MDHTLLKADATQSDIKLLCDEARKYRFAAVCVHPYWVAFCAEQLSDTNINVATVIGFPLGATTMEVKAFETKQAIERGAAEIDMVINLGALKSGDYDQVKKDIQAVVEAAEQKAIVKVILETGLLSETELKQACQLAARAGADLVKTSTGFGTGGATLSAVRLMKETVGAKIGVKASGGIRDYETAAAMIAAGATRIGTSAGVTIVTGGQGNQSDY
ncbi:deoxyribose-phosphate aldolase [Ammoniphilus oxalaticus]|uniref:Deoxyribose-phosphate aldolase n=1 Tax=Ammoniphilus oxalaticus TaxID=66863 RepID=A0A419SL82_9BACL|nr:deoxyribose-phosphate aldolase [Ammoniphilus oxalaticus]RKD24668.1 deoxyribose-phosphate aldolase [Ammoniphilus oxalaticus]